MANYVYDSLSNDNVRFLQGTQAQLNLYLPNAPATIPQGMTNAGNSNTFKGNAIEGAFYLTTDTHKLYIGRKVSTGDDANKVFPELVSGGVATVANTTALNAASSTANDGDIFYVLDGNILAVYEKDDTAGPFAVGKWVQINASAKVDSFSATTSVASNVATITHTIVTADHQAGYPASFTIKGSTASSGKGAVTISKDGSDLKIEASDTTYEAGAQDSTVANGAKIGLRKNGAANTTNLDSTITISGSGTVGVSSNKNGTVTVAGPTFSAMTAEAKSNGDGFDFALNYTPGTGAGATSTTATTLDPTISIGHVGDSGVASPSAVHYTNGNATLDVYSADQTDAIITKRINSAIQTADAMKYCGTVAASTDLPTTSSTTKPHRGDTYKATTQFTLGSSTVYPGDLVIAQGTETNGEITSNLTWDIVPSGNEPWAQPNITTSDASSNSNGVVGLTDKNNSDAAILNVAFVKSTDKIRVDVGKTDNNNATVTISHKTTTRAAANDANGFSTPATGDTDSFQGNKKVFYVLKSGGADITTDSYGHVTGVKTQKVVFEHNKLDTANTTYSSTYNANTGASTASASVALADTLTSTTVTGTTGLASDTIKFTNSSSAIQMDLVWGSF